MQVSGGPNWQNSGDARGCVRGNCGGEMGQSAELHCITPNPLHWSTWAPYFLTMFYAFQLLQWRNFSYIFQENWKFTRRVVLQNTPNLYTGVLCTFKLYYFVKPKCVESILLHIQCLIYFADVKHSEEEGDSVRGKSAFSLSEIRRDCCSGVQSV